MAGPAPRATQHNQVQFERTQQAGLGGYRTNLCHGFDLERDAVGQHDYLLVAPDPTDEEGAVEDAVLGSGRYHIRERGGASRAEQRHHRVEGAGADLDLLVDALR